jgi:hypothetical protein
MEHSEMVAAVRQEVLCMQKEGLGVIDPEDIGARVLAKHPGISPILLGMAIQEFFDEASRMTPERLEALKKFMEDGIRTGKLKHRPKGARHAS